MNGRLFGIGLSGGLLDFLYGHGAAAHANDFSFFLQLEKIPSERHLRYIGKIFFELFQRQLSALIQKLGDFLDAFSFHPLTSRFFFSIYQIYHKNHKKSSK